MANPNNHPLWHLYGQLSACFFSTSLHPAALPSLPFREHLWPSLHGTCHTCQSPELPKHTFSHTKGSLQPDGLPHHIWRVLTLVSGTQYSPSSVSTMLGSELFIKPHIKAYNTPSNRNFYFQVRQSLSEYLNMITSSPLFQESTLPRVYSSRSCVCPLFHPRNHALLLRESPALSLKSPGSSPPLTMGAAH